MNKKLQLLHYKWSFFLLFVFYTGHVLATSQLPTAPVVNRGFGVRLTLIMSLANVENRINYSVCVNELSTR